MKTVATILFDWPARLVGMLVGVAWYAIVVAATFGGGGLAYEFSVRKMRRELAAVIAIVVGLYAGAIALRSAHWAAFTLLEIGERLGQ